MHSSSVIESPDNIFITAFHRIKTMNIYNIDEHYWPKPSDRFRTFNVHRSPAQRRQLQEGRGDGLDMIMMWANVKVCVPGAKWSAWPRPQPHSPWTRSRGWITSFLLPWDPQYPSQPPSSTSSPTLCFVLWWISECEGERLDRRWAQLTYVQIFRCEIWPGQLMWIKHKHQFYFLRVYHTECLNNTGFTGSCTGCLNNIIRDLACKLYTF